MSFIFAKAINLKYSERGHQKILLGNTHDKKLCNDNNLVTLFYFPRNMHKDPLKTLKKLKSSYLSLSFTK